MLHPGFWALAVETILNDEIQYSTFVTDLY